MNHRTVAQLERYNRTLFMDLEKEKRARRNWQRIRILIAILKLCGNRMEKFETVIQKKEKRKKTCDDYMLKLINSPNDLRMRAWIVFSSLFYMIGLFLDSFMISFAMYPIGLGGRS